MADAKISELMELTDPASDDLLAVVDDIIGNPVTKRVTLENIQTLFLNNTQETILSAAYPVGAIYISVVSTNPATLFGFGTWVAFGTGRALVGIDATQSEFDVAEETGGAKTHTLTTAELATHNHTGSTSATSHTHGASSGNPSANHTHVIDPPATASGIQSASHDHTVFGYDVGAGTPIRLGSTALTTNRITVYTGDQRSSHTHTTNIAPFTSSGISVNHTHQITVNAETAHTHGVTVNNTGSGTAHNNLQPYIVVHMFKRTA